MNVVTTAPTKLLMSAGDAAARLSVSRNTVYELMAAGRIRSVHVGTRRLISEGALLEFIAENENSAA